MAANGCAADESVCQSALHHRPQLLFSASAQSGLGPGADSLVAPKVQQDKATREKLSRMQRCSRCMISHDLPSVAAARPRISTFVHVVSPS